MSKAEIFMKSGNVITLDNIKDCHIKYSGDEITSFRLETLDSAYRILMVPSLNLSQIEAIVYTKDVN